MGSVVHLTSTMACLHAATTLTCREAAGNDQRSTTDRPGCHLREVEHHRCAKRQPHMQRRLHSAGPTAVAIAHKAQGGQNLQRPAPVLVALPVQQGFGAAGAALVGRVWCEYPVVLG